MTTDHGGHVSTYDRLEEPTGISLSVDTDRSRALLARRGFVFFDRCR